MKKYFLNFGTGANKENAPYLYYPILWLIAVFSRLLFFTIKMDVSKKDYECLSRNVPSILLIWHNRIAITAYIRYTFRKGHTMCGLISKSKDGAILERFFSFFKIQSERGSSGKGGARAAVNLIRILRNGGDICITPDGPRGPKYIMKDGAMLICKKSECRILFMRGDFSNYWTLKSWDGFIIPKPFSTVKICADEFENYAALEAAAADKNMTAQQFAHEFLG